jgi:hypothetical protein
LRTLSRGGIYEDLEPSYNDDEERLFEINHEVRDLIQLLEQKNISLELEKDED